MRFSNYSMMLYQKKEVNLMVKVRNPIVSPVVSLLLSFFASSHHWLHMTILLLLGNSTNMMSTMQNLLWLRRFMIIMTVIMIFFTIYRLIKHRCTHKIALIFNVVSILASLGFIFYTLLTFGW